MSQSAERLVVWAPRVLAILVALFLSLFAADVFGQGAPFWETAGALVIHLIPTWIVLAVLAASWRRPTVGATVFPSLGVLYVVLAWGRFHWSAYAAIAGPLFVLGILYAIAWLHARRHARPAA